VRECGSIGKGKGGGVGGVPIRVVPKNKTEKKKKRKPPNRKEPPLTKVSVVVKWARGYMIPEKKKKRGGGIEGP